MKEDDSLQRRVDNKDAHKIQLSLNGLCYKGMNLFSSFMIMTLSVLILTVAAFAQDEVTIKGEVRLVDLKMKALVVETYDRKDITITIDDGALKKFEKGVIKEGDDVTVKCIVRNGRLISVSFFRKARG